MTKLIKKLVTAKNAAEKKISAMPSEEKKQLEERWDIEHAYYSSALEGSKIDRKEFDELAKQAK